MLQTTTLVQNTTRLKTIEKNICCIKEKIQILYNIVVIIIVDINKTVDKTKFSYRVKFALSKGIQNTREA